MDETENALLHCQEAMLPGQTEPVFSLSCTIPTKTITLEIDAYEKLRLAKRGGESFTEVGPAGGDSGECSEG